MKNLYHLLSIPEKYHAIMLNIAYVIAILFNIVYVFVMLNDGDIKGVCLHLTMVVILMYLYMTVHYEHLNNNSRKDDN